ncbi:cytochrome c oxidase subunit II [Erythrobacter sp. EC-HK427]|uniref:cytochrome c oxidase subunit II n=1 Tax=Erythrobacter sp. EC-HK427 TaxID=2038396 RepID=UPI001258D64F|nr:cytochrome c oxidase subunit II [Erythrobacter sp. EC-HK427]VVT11865.1 Cytochrome c oxidase subunit 2 [Erythrobacter sp. EC-HK427]
MTFGDFARTPLQKLAMMLAAFSMIAAPALATAQDAVVEEAVVETATAPATEAAPADEAAVAAEAPAFEHFGADMIKGQPEAGGIDFQPQFTADGQFAHDMHNYLLMPIITVISLFVLGLLLWVIVRYRRSANPVPSKTSHNTLIEVIWTVVPVIILVVIAVPSITLLARQYETPPEDAITIKANGYQWYWGYEYTDNGGFEVISNMLTAEEALDTREPFQLAVDNRMVVPVGVPLRIQTYGADVIHSFAIPSLWFKLDAVPGRINERMLLIEEEGIYYGQCMELCGSRHGYMPIAIEARSMEDYNAWVQAQGGQTREQIAAEAAAAAAPAPAAEEAPVVTGAEAAVPAAE